MKGLFNRRMRKRIMLLVILAAFVSVFAVYSPDVWLSRFAADKVSEFMGNRMTVNIGSISGGLFRDMVLKDVEFISGKGEKEKVFQLKRMEISYRMWWVLAEKAGIFPVGKHTLENVSVFFSDDNPFVRGHIKLHRSPGKIEVVGDVSPIVFGIEEKRGIKGSFTKRDDEKYDGELLWDGNLGVSGVLDPFGRSVELNVAPLDSKKGVVKIQGGIVEDGEVQIYSRIDKVNLFGTELIGDVWLSYKDDEMPVFSFRSESLIVNKRPFWNVSVGGRFSKVEKTVYLEEVKWGEGINLKGTVSTEEPYPVDLKLSMEHVELEEVRSMFTESDQPFSGKLEGEIEFSGPAQTAEVKGRLYIGGGVMGAMEFRSIFATLKGKLPVVEVVDSRVVQNGGLISIEGEMDFSRAAENKIFEKVVFDTDNKVAVWEDWQIAKEERDNVVEAKKDNLTITTAMEDSAALDAKGATDPMHKQLGIGYNLDTWNSLKFETKDDDNFLGLEHKMEF